MSTAVKSGDTVAVHYTGKLEDGSVFDSSVSREPLQFVLGEKRVIPGFEQAILGMTAGESKTAKIPAAEAYGERREDLVLQFERSQLPEGLEPEVGMGLQMQGPQGQPVPVTVTKVEEASITIDANHQLAGQNLNFELELVEVA